MLNIPKFLFCIFFKNKTFKNQSTDQSLSVSNNRTRTGVVSGQQTDLDVVVVLQPVLYVVQEGEDVQPVQAAVQQSIHALERSLPQVQPVVHRVFEGTHLHLRTANSRSATWATPRATWATPTCRAPPGAGSPHLSDQLLPHFGLVVKMR